MISPVTYSPLSSALLDSGAQPNELDLRRIKRMLEKRERYRYVTVNIAPTPCGYQITSPCCSRSIASDGQMIDIALIEYDETFTTWKLFNKDHAGNSWCLHHCSETLKTMVEYLITDPAKVFWQ
jgi:hypothetical protein